MTPVEVVCGDGPIVLGLPHTGTYVPEDIFSKLAEKGRELADTDWHIHELYDGLLANVTTVRATFHRYVIDANRDPSGVSLYPGQNTTGLVPTTDFHGDSLWEEPPTEVDIETRRAEFHAAYHAALSSELERVREINGIAVLYDCHSIRSEIPFLFEGVLPDFNIGTNHGVTCASVFADRVETLCAEAEGYTAVTNGRFKGGWTTRHYGQPDTGVHAIQMELAQSTYLMEERHPWTYDDVKAEKLRVHLRRILETLTVCANQRAGVMTSGGG